MVDEPTVEGQEAPDTPPETGQEVTETPSEDTSETLLAGKYKTPEDLANAYKELESKFGQTSNEAKQAREELAQIQAQIQYQQQQAQQQAQYDKTEEERLREDLNKLQWDQFQSKMEAVQKDFLDKNKDLAGDLGENLLNSIVGKLRVEKPYQDPFQTGNVDNFKALLEEGAKQVRTMMEGYTTAATETKVKDVVETREEVKVGAGKSGAPVETKEEVESAPESLSEYGQWRSELYERTRTR